VRRGIIGTGILDTIRDARVVRVVAAGKAAAGMLRAFPLGLAKMGVGPGEPGDLPSNAEWFRGAHPVPDAGSTRAARRALQIAREACADDVLVLLLSGGASAMMAVPAEGLELAEKRQVVHRLLQHGASIHDLNTVRKHLSAIKGGQLASECLGRTVTLAISDVVGDDLSVIGSGPAVADATTWAMALDVIEQYGGAASFSPAIVSYLRSGAAGERSDTPKPGDARLARAEAHVIGGRADAMQGAAQAAESLGYQVVVINEPVIGEAALAARDHVNALAGHARLPRPLCVVSAGETTVNVRGRGLGGRNQEFALAMAPILGALGAPVVAASLGTDGVDGPTDAAGAIVDTTTLARAATAGLNPPSHYLANNDAHTFFLSLGDLIRTGPTGTNVGDLQVVLIDE